MNKILKNIGFAPAIALAITLALILYILKVLKNAIMLKDIGEVFNGINSFIDKNHKESGFIAVAFCLVSYLFLIAKLFTWLKK